METESHRLTGSSKSPAEKPEGQDEAGVEDTMRTRPIELSDQGQVIKPVGVWLDAMAE